MFRIAQTEATWCDDCGAEDRGPKVEIAQSNRQHNDKNMIVVHVACLLKRVGAALAK